MGCGSHGSSAAVEKVHRDFDDGLFSGIYLFGFSAGSEKRQQKDADSIHSIFGGRIHIAMDPAGRTMRKRYCKSGYMTVEASLLLPLINVLIAMIMTLTIHIYSVCVLNQTAYIAAFRGSQVTDGNIKETTNAALEELLDNRLLNVGMISSEIKVSVLSVEVKLEAETILPFAEILPVSGSHQKITAIKEVKIRNAPGYIRILRKV